MPFSNNNLTRDDVLSRYFPDYQAVVDVPAPGLSGGSMIIENQGQRCVLRRHHDPCVPAFHFHRHYQALRRLPGTLAPSPRFYTSGWMVVDYVSGDVISTLPASEALASLLYHLHQQPRFGWRVLLIPQLTRYWQCADPRRRTPFWLRMLKTLNAQGEPNPLRLAPLHMDVHAGNIVHTNAGLRLIDWEYAGDGDIALELAAVWASDGERQSLLDAYAHQANLQPELLLRQVRRWQPWLRMLMATWYEYRWQQTSDQQFIVLADEIWCQLGQKNTER